MVDKMTDKVRRRRGNKGDGHEVNPRKQNGKKRNEKAAKSTSNGYSKALLIHFTEDAPTWYACGHQTLGRDGTVASDPPSPTDLQNSGLVAKYRSEADELYRREVQNFGNSGSSDERWVENTMKRGTLKDRIAAMSVVVSTNPVHKLYALDGLLQMAGCSGGQTNSRMAQMAAEALEDLFLSTLLPPNRKLVSLDQRPLYRYEGQTTVSPRVLLLWRYEEMIKEKFQLFASQYLMQTLKDGMEMSKVSALRTTSTLLRSTPEGEMQLLGMLVNKLGDPSKKIAAAAGHELRRVLDQHANMQIVIAREVQQLAHRPHLSPRALYNCIVFLNQLHLTSETKQIGTKDNGSSKAPKQSSLPASLINTYFRLFEVAVSKSKEDNSNSGMKSRLLSALLMGVNRAHPFLPEEDKDLEDHINSLYRVVHTGPPSASTQALMLLFHVAVGSEEASKTTSKTVTCRQDRFYRALFATLSQPSIIATGKHLTLYFNLLYKAMKLDTNSTRVVAFAKRLLCTTMHTSPPVMTSSLFLVNEIMKYHPLLKSCFVDVAEGQDATAVLDPTKREPAAALTANDESNSNEGTVIHAPLWEACLVAHSFHPSVAKFASTLSKILYMGDPLRDFTLATFLDKFAYRNPKTSKKLKRGESVAERRSGMEEPEPVLKALPVNDPSFLKKTDIDEQDEFYHKFFVERARRDEIKGTDRAKKSEADDDDEGEDEAFDMAENINLDHNFEKGWDTDEDEEAFVDSLAEKLIEDAAEADDLDDEDPNMKGWDDMRSGDNKSNEKKDAGSSDEDAFLDKMDDMSDGGNSDGEEGPEFNGHAANEDDAFMANDDSDSDDSQPEGTVDGDDDDDSDGGFVIEDSDSDEDEDELSKKRKCKREEIAFVDASEYEEIINKGWQDMKRVEPPDLHEDDDSEAARSMGGRKKRKRRPKKKLSSSV